MGTVRLLDQIDLGLGVDYVPDRLLVFEDIPVIMNPLEKNSSVRIFSLSITIIDNIKSI